MAKASRFRYTTLGRESMLLLLTLAAASVDAISYLGLGHVFTAMMTGNTVLLGLALAQGEVLAALRSILALVGFAIGVFAGAIIVERESYPAEWPAAVTTALAFETIILAIFAANFTLLDSIHGGMIFLLIVLSAFAMGVQSAAVRRLGVPGIATTLHYRNANESDGGPLGLAPFHRRATPGGKNCRTQRGFKGYLGISVWVFWRA